MDMVVKTAKKYKGRWRRGGAKSTKSSQPWRKPINLAWYFKCHYFPLTQQKGLREAVLLAMRHHVNHFCKKKKKKKEGNYFPGPNVINLNSLVSQIVAHNKYGAARDAYRL